MTHVGKLTQLQSLHLRGLPITDAGLGALSGLTGVHVLYLDRTQIQGPGLARLSGLPRLMTLSLSGSAVTNEGLSYLSGVPVAHLMLDDVPLTDVGLKALARCAIASTAGDSPQWAGRRGREETEKEHAQGGDRGLTMTRARRSRLA